MESAFARPPRGYILFRQGYTRLMTSLQHTNTTPSAPVQQPEPVQHRTLLRPASGALILGLDWLLWSTTVATGGVAAVATGITGLIVGGTGTGLIQKHFAKDSPRAAFWKGVAAGIIVGAPFPIAGTAVGGTVLALSGLDRILKRRRIPPGP